MKQRCSTLFIIAGLLFSLSVSANSVRLYNLNADSWARPRSGESIPQFEPVKLAVEYWSSLSEGEIVLTYPGQDSGEIWAAELRDWLVSLGVPSEYIHLSPGLQSGGDLQIKVGQKKELID